ncbi:hypothetical protein BD779DRAFT_1706346 [Infundibulicybe gibba]|nr:hypothetical protein BD779DRAFT_1706346 [Infundibulicybe gibba]
MRGWDAWTGLPAPERMSSPTGWVQRRLETDSPRTDNILTLGRIVRRSRAYRGPQLRFYIRPLPCNRRLDVPPCRMTSNPGAPHMARHTPVPAPMPPHVFITGDAARDEDVANSAQRGAQVDAVAHWQHGYSGVTVPPGDGDASAIRRSGSEWSDDRLVYIIDLGGRGVEACRHGDGAVWRGSTGRQRGIGERNTDAGQYSLFSYITGGPKAHQRHIARGPSFRAPTVAWAPDGKDSTLVVPALRGWRGANRLSLSRKRDQATFEQRIYKILENKSRGPFYKYSENKSRPRKTPADEISSLYSSTEVTEFTTVSHRDHKYRIYCQMLMKYTGAIMSRNTYGFAGLSPLVRPPYGNVIRAWLAQKPGA